MRHDNDSQNIAVVGVNAVARLGWCDNCPWFHCCCRYRRCQCCYHHPGRGHRFVILTGSGNVNWPHCNDPDYRRFVNSGDLFDCSRKSNQCHQVPRHPSCPYGVDPRYLFSKYTVVVVAAADGGNNVGYRGDPRS